MTKTIMIVDDDEDLRAMLVDAFEGEGYQVLEAADGDKALRLFAHSPADVVITDILMPNTEGIETIFELKRRHKLKNIIAVSGGGRTGNKDFLEAAKDMGIAKVFSKPIDLNDLITYVDSLFTDQSDSDEKTP